MRGSHSKRSERVLELLLFVHRVEAVKFPVCAFRSPPESRLSPSCRLSFFLAMDISWQSSMIREITFNVYLVSRNFASLRQTRRICRLISREFLFAQKEAERLIKFCLTRIYVSLISLETVDTPR